MRFYYTGASAQFQPQLDPQASLGGFISSSVVPNDSLQNLFSALSYSSFDNTNYSTYIMLALKNELPNDIDNLKVYFDFNNPKLSNLEIACLVNSNNQFEKVSSINTAPYFANFVSADGQSNEKNLGKLKKGEYLGIWFKRTLDATAYKSLYSRENLISTNPLVLKKEIIKLNLNWDNL